jgi:hypothetical protein
VVDQSLDFVRPCTQRHLGWICVNTLSRRRASVAECLILYDLFDLVGWMLDVSHDYLKYTLGEDIWEVQSQYIFAVATPH